MGNFNNYKLLCDMVETLDSVDNKTTDRVSSIRKLKVQLNKVKDSLLDGETGVSPEDMAKYQNAVDSAVEGRDIELLTNVETTHSIEMFQLGVSSDNVVLDFDTTSTKPPEHGYIIQKLWEVKFKDVTTGHVIFSDTSDEDLCRLVGAQLSTALLTAPTGAVEDLDITVSMSSLKDIITTNKSQNLSSVFIKFEKPGLVARQLRDIDIDTEPELLDLNVDKKTAIKTAVTALNNASTPEQGTSAQTQLQEAATDAGMYSTSLGPTPNHDYSDLKRFKLQKEDNTIVTVVASIPVVSWGAAVHGIPLRKSGGSKDKSNRKDCGMSYVVDLGGMDPVIRNAKPNPLPAKTYINYGPAWATPTEGALERYAGGKCLGINTTNQEVTFIALHRGVDGEITVNVPANSALWKLDRATFDGGNKHAYYTVFSSSRPPPSGFMGVPFSPKQGRLGRGRGDIASGVTLANGMSKTGKTFNKQNSTGAILEAGEEVPSGLKGVTSHYDGHGMDPKDLLKFLQENDFIKGSNYLTIPADAALDTVEDILIPAGEFIPQITQALGVLSQFSNGTYIQDGGPSRYQPGLIPFLPGTLAYTPEWHINMIVYNCGEVFSDGTWYTVEDPAPDNTPESWLRAEHNASLGAPGPNPTNSYESKYSPAFPDNFDPVQTRVGMKWTNCREYVDKIPGSKDGEITLGMLSSLERDNKIFFTEAPAGAMRGWVKYLVVNCPLPLIVTVNVVGEEAITPTPNVPEPEGNCVTCSCSRDASSISINGELNPIWLDENDEGVDNVIGDRVLKFKVGDNIVIRATSSTMHGASLRFDDTQSNKTFDTNKTLEVIQSEVLAEIKERVTINNEQDLENNFIAISGDLINFHGGIPITFSQKAVARPEASPDGVVIADFLIKEGSEGLSGSVGCTVHGSSMSFRFLVCE